MSDSTWSFSQSFSAQFQTSHSDLETRVNNAKSSAPISEELLQLLSTTLAGLVKRLADATGSLPSYDQRLYEKQLKTIESSLSDLRGSSKSRSKFAFKRKAATSATGETIALPVVPDRQNTPSIPTSTNNTALSGHSYQYLTLESLQKLSSPEDLAIRDLDHCIVNLISSPEGGSFMEQSSHPLRISALHIQNLSDTVLLLPPVDGSVLIHDLTRCTIVVGCHQYRMHTSRNVNVYLNVSSDPVIEHCSDIRFGAYPSVLGHSPNSNKHFNVLDFSHIRSSPSPHWSIFGDDRVSPEWPLQNMALASEILDETRERILPV